MTRHASFDLSISMSARSHSVAKGWKNLSQSKDYTKECREWFAALLWHAFPSDSERELSEKSSRALGCSARQVSNWLRCENDASLTIVLKVMLVAKVELILQKIEGA